MTKEVFPAIRWALGIAGAMALAIAAGPAAAKVAQVSESGFVIQHAQVVAASPAEVWQLLLRPARWWDSDHTWSGDAANLTIDPRAGGCFCEVLPSKDSPRAAPRGTVEHMRVVYVEEPRVLRMVGSLGPLQGDAVTGTLTFQLKPAEKGTAIMMEYVVGGFSRVPMAQISGGVDGMLAQQLAGLIARLGGAVSLEAPAKGKAKAAPAKEPAAEAPVGEAPVPDLFDLPAENAPADAPDGESAEQPVQGNPNLPSGR
ncbi:SRPBCC domain-containing protein [Novosphingobium colocasiae]|uniref:SRPBCC family protein n=1 Tax=Novosphingobium colocasiae TaxID=1256513 RepID=UPI0035AF1F57